MATLSTCKRPVSEYPIPLRFPRVRHPWDDADAAPHRDRFQAMITPL